MRRRAWLQPYRELPLPIQASDPGHERLSSVLPGGLPCLTLDPYSLTHGFYEGIKTVPVLGHANAIRDIRGCSVGDDVDHWGDLYAGSTIGVGALQQAGRDVIEAVVGGARARKVEKGRVRVAHGAGGSFQLDEDGLTRDKSGELPHRQHDQRALDPMGKAAEGIGNAPFSDDPVKLEVHTQLRGCGFSFPQTPTADRGRIGDELGGGPVPPFT